jgi:hypothetical protein
MEKFNSPKEMIDFLESKGYKIKNMAYDDISKDLIGEVTEISSNREGSDYDILVIVNHYVDQGFYISFSGYYSSWEGCEFDEWCEVEPMEVTKIEYVAKK